MLQSLSRPSKSSAKKRRKVVLLVDHDTMESRTRCRAVECWSEITATVGLPSELSRSAP